jgi:hypothetical protein
MMKSVFQVFLLSIVLAVQMIFSKLNYLKSTLLFIHFLCCCFQMYDMLIRWQFSRIFWHYESTNLRNWMLLFTFKVQKNEKKNTVSPKSRFVISKLVKLSDDELISEFGIENSWTHVMSSLIIFPQA